MHHRSLFVAALCAALLFAGCKAKQAATPPPPPDVAVKVITPEDVPVSVTSVGRIVSNNSVSIVARVTGQLL